MRVEHGGESPVVHPSSWVAPTAVLSGDVEVGPDSRVLFGAVLTSDGGPVRIGSGCVVMENAVLRGTRRHPLHVWDRVLIGPRSYLSGCTVEEEAFLATGSTVFNGARIGRQAEVQVNGTVHVRSRLEDGATVPIGWVAVGDPATILPPDRHDEIWAIQEGLDFPGEVFGVARSEDMMTEIMHRYVRGLGRHFDDRVLDD